MKTVQPLVGGVRASSLEPRPSPAPAARPTAPAAAGSNRPDDVSRYSGKVQVGATQQEDGSFVLFDTTRGQGIETIDAAGRGSEARPPLEGLSVVDDDNHWGDRGDDPRNTAAIDAQYAGQMTYDFLKNVLGFNSIDGRGQKLQLVVHVGDHSNSAFWFPATQTMNLGDGDGVQFGPITSVDVIGHELVHGLIGHTAKFASRDPEYGTAMAGLGEAMADIIGGAGVEWYALQKNPQLRGKVDPYTIGEQVYTPGIAGDAIRYMENPRRDRGVDFWHEEYEPAMRGVDVHRVAGIANNAFYLLTHGGQNSTSGIEVKDPIGMESGLKIFGRALIHYMAPTGGFRMARQATVQAAADLFGPNSDEVARVTEAWTAVGVPQARFTLRDRLGA